MASKNNIILPNKKLILPNRKIVLPCPQQIITDLGGKYYFDQKAVDKVVGFMRQLKHTKSPWTGKPFIPMQWVYERIISPLFGWKRSDDKTRRFRRLYAGVPKKNAKSADASAFNLYLFMGDGEFGAEVYAAANERGQAGIVFNESKAQLRFSPLRKLIEPNPIKASTKTLLFPATSSKYTTLSKDSSTKDGMSIHGLSLDEFHALRDAAYHSVLTQGSGAARRQPLHMIWTTAGYDRNSVCYSEYLAAKEVIKNEKYDEELLGVIYEADEKDDWTDPKVWAKANPSLGTTLTLRDMEHDCMVAQKKPAEQNNFKRLRLNLWTSQLTRWLDAATWDRAGRDYDLAFLQGLAAFGGLDLSSNKDLTTFGLAVPKEEGVYLWPYIFMPADNIYEASKRDHVPYDRWVADGYIFATPGNVIDYDFIMAKMEEANAFMDLQSVQFDAWRAAQVAAAAEKCNIKMIPVAQSPAGMGAPCFEFERLLTSGRLFHPKNPCMTWAANNIEVRTTYGGLITPNKPAETHGQQKRIDPIVASILALERIARGVKPESTDSQHIRSL